MEGVEQIVSADALTRLFLILLYASVIFLSYRRLFPRLSPTCARIAGGFLAAQALVIILALEHRPPSSLEWWLWDLNREYNIASTLASIQLAMVGGVALMTAGLARALPAWRRLYLVAIALVFMILAWDEYYILHEEMRHWKRYYTALGIAVALSTMYVALRSPRRAWIWHSCFLTGLALSGTGAIIFEELPQICDNLGLLFLGGCLQFDVWEECLEFFGVWLMLAAMLGYVSDEAPNPKPRIRLMLYALPAFWILPLFINARLPQLELQLLARSASVEFESGLRLRGYRIDSVTGATHIRLYASAKRGQYRGIGYSAHLVDQVSGETIASADEWADPFPGFWMLRPGATPIYRQWMDVVIPPEAPSNRALWITLSLWREQDAERSHLRILASDRQLLNEKQVILQELVLPGPPVAFRTSPLAAFENGFSLAPVRLPEHAVPGETLDIIFAWRAEEPGREDLLQFLHLEHVDSGEWWIFDQQPLGPRLPTRLWYSGLADKERWEVPIPADLVAGEYAVFTGLYRVRDLERVPVADNNGRPFLDARVPLGRLELRR